MKQVLLIDAPPLFGEFLKDKLVAEQVKVELATGDRDAFQKLVNTLPDLVIIDVENDILTLQDFLDSKIQDPNAVRIPIIISGPEIPRNQVSALVKYGVVKYFAKPIKFDVFFEAISMILKTTLTIDDTPCVLETHVNGNIIFVEIAQGLNRDKLSLLKYKLKEILDHGAFHDPKLILMMTNLELTFVDGANLELLFDNIIEDERIKRTNVKVLSLNEFTRELLDGHPLYKGIEVVDNVTDVLSSLVDSGTTTDLAQVVSDKLLQSDAEQSGGAIEMRFGADGGGNAMEEAVHESSLKVAIVDDDAVTGAILKNSFRNVNAEALLFDSGVAFMQSLATEKYDVIILDLYLPDLSGFDILAKLQRQGLRTPILVYSQASSREAVIQALSLGAKSYLAKPQKPAVIIQKALDVLEPSA